MELNWKTVCIIIVCVFGLFLDGYVLQIASVSIPFIQQTYNPDTWMVGLIQAAAPIGAVFGAIVTGRLSDYFGRKRILILNLVFFILTALLSAFSWNIYSVILFRLLAGITVGMDYPICATYLAEVVSSHKISRYMAISMLGNCLAAPASTLIAWNLSTFADSPDFVWRCIFLSTLIPVIATIFFRIQLKESVLWKLNQHVTKKASLMAPYKVIFSRDYLRVTVIVCLGWFSMQVAYFGVGLFAPLICHEFIQTSTDALLSDSIKEIFKYSFWMGMVGCLGSLVAVFYLPKWKIIAAQMIGFLGSSIGLLLVALSFMFQIPHYMMWSFLGFILFSFFINVGPGVTAYLLPARVYSTDIRGTGHGFASGCAKTGAVLGAFMMPILANSLGLYNTLLVLSAFLMIGSLLSYAMPSHAYSRHDANELKLRTTGQADL